MRTPPNPTARRPQHNPHRRLVTRPSLRPRAPGDLSVDAAGLITAGLETIADRVPSEKLREVERRLVGKAVDLAAS